MPTPIVTVAQVLEAVETDLPDAVLTREVATASEDIRTYLPEAHIDLLPTIVWQGDYMPDLGVTDNEITLDSSILGYPQFRLEGDVTISGDPHTFTVDTTMLTSAGATDILTPVLADRTTVAGGTFNVEIDAAGTTLTIDTTSTTNVLRFTHAEGLQDQIAPPRIESAVLDLVMLAVQYRGIDTERVGQYNVALKDYHTERGKVLARLVLASGVSVAY